MRPSAGPAPAEPATGPLYREPARGYASTVLLVAVLGSGFALDLALGGARVHLAAWAAAVTVVLGADLLAIRAARAQRSLTVTATEVRVGAQAVPRHQIVGYHRDADPRLPVLGLGPAASLPHRTAGLAVRLADGTAVLLPTRHPERLRGLLGVPEQRLQIRPPREPELALLPQLCDRARPLYRVCDLQLPDLPPPGAHRPETRLVLVAGDPPAGFVRVVELDTEAHLDALAVLPGQMRRGVGTALLQAACDWAALRYRALTVTAYTQVAWEAPFYTARGFTPVPEPTPELAELRDWERAVGLDRLGPRVVLRRELARPGGAAR